MRITRRFTRKGQSPYAGVRFRRCAGPSGRWFDAPEFWSLESIAVLARRCVEDARVAACLKPVREDDVPSFLWRHEPDAVALSALPADRRYSGETDLRAVIDRLAGFWAYMGWKAGYFDSDRDAAAFFDEIRWLLLHRKAAPELSTWRHAGLHWAYGIDASVPDSFLADYRTGAVGRGGPETLPPGGAVINGVTADATGDAGIWALFRNQARLAALGCPAGVDLSALATGTGDDLAALLAPGDAAADTPRRLTLDAGHPQAESFAPRNVRAAVAATAGSVGRAIARRHAGALAEAAASPDGEAARRFAMSAATQAMLPRGMVDRITVLAATHDAAPVLEALDAEPAAPAQGPASVTVLAMDDEALAAADPATKPGRLLDGTALSAWMAGAAGLHYATTVDGTHGCAVDGPARSAAGDGDFLFLDDTAAGRAVLNVAAFLDDGGGFDVGGMRHAAGLLTAALDISLAAATYTTPRIARRVWDYRPVSLSPTGLATVLTGLGLAYDSEAGRDTAAALCALMTGTAYAVSAGLADELGAFPGWTRNDAVMRGVVANRADQATGGGCAITGLAEAARQVWAEAAAGGDGAGYRNAHVSAIFPARDETALMEVSGAGIASGNVAIRHERLEGGGYRRAVHPTVVRGLRALGYDEDAIGRILRRLMGHGSIERAPGVNHEALRRRGFTEAAIAAVEAAVRDVPDIRLVFNVATLGEDFCTRMLGFTAVELKDPEFDMLSALGFSDARIEAANIHCCGADTLEGAPGLSRDHLAVFDRSGRANAHRRRRIAPEAIVRMAAAVQPFLSGAVGHVVALPHDATVGDFRDLLLLGWKLGLKTLTLRRDADDAAPAEDGRPAAGWRISAVPDVPAPAERPAALPEPDFEFPAMSQALALAHTARGLADGMAHEKIIAEDRKKAGGDARASRRGSPDPARSAASVPSSADVVVEQRQV